MPTDTSSPTQAPTSQPTATPSPRPTPPRPRPTTLALAAGTVPVVVTTDQAPLTPDEQAVRDAVVQSNTAWTAAMETASPAGLAAIKTGSNLAVTLASVADLRTKGQHYRIHLSVLEVVWAKVVGADRAQALVRKIGEHRQLYQRGHTHPVSEDTSGYVTLYDLVRLKGHWLITLTRIVDDATAGRLSTAPPDATSGPLMLGATATPQSVASAAGPGAGASQNATQRVMQSVVRVDVETALGTSTGTGFIIESTDSVSYVLTNDHVVADNTGTIRVTLSDGTAPPALGLREDPGDDLAVLAIAQPHLTAVTWAPHASEAVGEPAIAVGYAEGMAGPPSVTSGVVSALDRGLGNGLTYLQHSAQINPGNSGGPLADVQGRVLGVNSYGLSNTQGIFFAIPGERARPVMRDLIARLSGVSPAPSDAGASSGAGNAGPSDTATPAPSSMDPVSVVLAFYQALTARDYGAAYDLFTRRLQGEIDAGGGLQAWAVLYADEQSVTVTNAQVVAQDAKSATVSLHLTSTWTSGDASRDFTGTWRLLYGERGWRLDKPDLSRVSTTSGNASMARFAGRWLAHAALATISPGGTVDFRQRTYSWCGLGVSEPCDRFQGNSIIYGVRVVAQIVVISGHTAQGVVRTSTAPAAYPVGATLDLTLDDGEHLHVSTIGQHETLLCGPSAHVGDCGA